MYDSLSNDYDIPITASTISSSSPSNHDYDIPQGSGEKKIYEFICMFNKEKEEEEKMLSCRIRL